MADNPQKHVFISYVRENSKEVDRLCDVLTKHGVHVWLDRNKILPGARWREAIRSAIRRGDFFIACFSKEYASRVKSYMNEELTLAIEELRQFPTDRVWFIPVLLSECDVPARSIGAGETLLDINWVPLYENWDAGIRRILEVIRPIPIETQNLIQALTSHDSKVRQSAAEALGKIGDPASIPALTTALSDEHSDVRLYAAEALWKIGDPAAVPALITALSDQDRSVRFRAAEALEQIADPGAVPALTAALSDEYPNVRWRAASALGAIGDPATVPALLIASLGDRNDNVRNTCTLALAMMGAAAVPGFTAALSHKDSNVRSRAAEQLGYLRDSAAVPALTSALSDEDRDVRIKAAEALEKIRPKGHRP